VGQRQADRLFKRYNFEHDCDLLVFQNRYLSRSLTIPPAIEKGKSPSTVQVPPCGIDTVVIYQDAVVRHNRYLNTGKKEQT